ncbi:MAG: NAD(P)(+) transhydrogenase (Re/Si-specific) subunit alpha, partial [Candidatus Limnocylindria bacterium]
MRVVVPREATPGEGRVALVPDSVGRLAPAGFEIVVERGAGAAAGFPDEEYTDAGATLCEHGALLDGAQAIIRVARPSAEEVAAISAGTVMIGFLAPLTDAEGIERLRRQGVIAFAMESVPRITRAQSMDALSSQATVAGYKAVLIAADRVQKMFPLLMTAAGTIAPAKVLVMGAGVAGLQAIATARRLGAVVSATDVRLAAKEQVESLGATFVMVVDDEAKQAETSGGYAK